MQTWLFAVVHDILRDGISIHFVYLSLIVVICFSTDNRSSLLSPALAVPKASTGLKEIKLMFFQSIENIQYLFLYNSFPLCSNMKKKRKEKKTAKAIQFNMNRYHDFYCYLCHKIFSYIMKPYNSEHHELLKPSQQSYVMKGTYILGVPEGAFTDNVLKC